MAPHFGLMDSGLAPPAAARQRALLHWRGGRRRLRQGKTALAVATLYDALLSGLRWHLLVNPGAARAEKGEAELENDGYILARAEQGGLLSSEDSLRIQALAETALSGEVRPTDQAWFVAELARVLTKIKLLPFPDSSLPPEDPDTD